MTQPDELQRLRRQLRAMASLNEQLRAQLEPLTAEVASSGGTRGLDPLQDPDAPLPMGAALRRARRAQAWVSPQARQGLGGTDPAYLVWRPDDGLFLIDGGIRRRVRSGMLAPSLERLLGEAGPIDDETFSAWPEGPPVEVLEAPTGGPFVMVGTRRLAVGGLPLPHPVPSELFDELAQGPTLDLIEATGARRAGEAAGWADRLDPASSGPAPTRGRARLVVGDEGMFLVEGNQRRWVTSGLLVPALEQLLGARRAEVDQELAGLDEGPPLAVLEAASGPPFVVVEGKRLPLRGLPLPHPVLSSSFQRLVEGPELDLVRSATARRLPTRPSAGWPTPRARSAAWPPWWWILTRACGWSRTNGVAGCALRC